MANVVPCCHDHEDVRDDHACTSNDHHYIESKDVNKGIREEATHSCKCSSVYKTRNGQ